MGVNRGDRLREFVTGLDETGVLRVLSMIERLHGVAMTVCTRRDVQDNWEFARDDDPALPVFGDEVFDRIRATWEWRRGWGDCECKPETLIGEAIADVAEQYRRDNEATTSTGGRS